MHSIVIALAKVNNNRFEPSVCDEDLIYGQMNNWADYVTEETEDTDLNETAAWLAEYMGCSYAGGTRIVVDNPEALQDSYRQKKFESLVSLMSRLKSTDNWPVYVPRAVSDKGGVWIYAEGSCAEPFDDFMYGLSVHAEKDRPLEFEVVQVFDYHF